jgi:hypothetical protein
MTQPDIAYPPTTSKAVVGARAACQTRPGDASDRTTPRFARHQQHVRAALAAGGFPVMPCLTR